MINHKTDLPHRAKELELELELQLPTRAKTETKTETATYTNLLGRGQGGVTLLIKELRNHGNLISLYQFSIAIVQKQRNREGLVNEGIRSDIGP